MTWLDWILVFIPLAAGRVAGRYVFCVASGQAARKNA